MENTDLKKIEEDIITIKEAIADTLIPDSLKGNLRENLAKLESEAEKIRTSKGKEEETPEAPKSEMETTKKRGRPKKSSEEKKQKIEKKAKEAKEKPKKAIIFDGKQISEDDVDFCEKMLDAWYHRKAKAKKAAKRYKTKSIFNKVVEPVGGAIERAIESIPAKQIAKNPKKYIRTFKSLESWFKDGLKIFEIIYEDKYKANEAKKALQPVSELISELKKKFSK